MFSHKNPGREVWRLPNTGTWKRSLFELDFKLPTNTRGETKIWLMGMQSYMLRGTKIVGATKHAQAGILPFKFPTQ